MPGGAKRRVVLGKSCWSSKTLRQVIKATMEDLLSHLSMDVLGGFGTMVDASDSDMTRASSDLAQKIPTCCGNLFLPKIWPLTKREVSIPVVTSFFVFQGFFLPSCLCARAHGYQTYRQSFSSCTRRTGDEPAFGVGVPPGIF